MATTHLRQEDLGWIELLKLRVQNLASAPSSPAEGWCYFDTTLHQFGVYQNGSWAYLGSSSYTDEMAQDAIGAMIADTATIDLTYVDATPALSAAVIDDSITNTKLANMATATFKGRTTAGTGDPEDLTVAQAKTLLAVASTDITDFAEAVSDQVGTMVTGNTETGISVTYQDGDNTLDFVVGTLDTLPAPTAALSLNSQKITNLATPTASTDAATKAYVDAAAVGIDWKASVRAATTAAGTLATSFENGDVIDGVTLATGDRILIKDQASGAENGIYTVNASGAPTRATDADTAAEVTAGLAVFVEEGTTNADSGWVLTNNGAITLGTTALTFTQFTGLGQVTAGNGLTKTGNTLDVATGAGLEISGDAVRIAAAAAGNGLTGGAGSALAVGAGTGITVNADDVAVDSSVVVRKYAAAITGGATSEVITHNLGTRDVHVTLRNNASPYDEVLVDNEATTTNTVTLRAAANLPAGYRVLVTA